VADKRDLDVNNIRVAGGTLSIQGALPAGTSNIGFVTVAGGTITASGSSAGTTISVLGPEAHDAPVASNPVLNGAIANDSDDTAPPNRVSTESDLVRLVADRDGSLHVLPYGPQVWDYHEDSSAGQSAVVVHAAPGAGLSLYVKSVTFALGQATSMNFWLTVGTTTKVLGPFYLEDKVGRGVHLPFLQPKKITVNSDLRIHTSATVTHSVDILGFTGQG